MTRKAQTDRVAKVITLLKRDYPEARTALHFSNPLELLVATILSAQCTDDRVNRVTQSLFKKYPSVSAYARADLKQLEVDVKPTGFFRNKAKSLKSCCGVLADRFSGKVPENLDDLVTLPGIGRKTANLVLGCAFGIPGIVVDTHVRRVSQRLGLTENENPDKIEQDLMKIIPKEEWTLFSLRLIFHGRSVCQARKPLCRSCSLHMLCPYGRDVLKEKRS
jgi:endonuclease-3